MVFNARINHYLVWSAVVLINPIPAKKNISPIMPITKRVVAFALCCMMLMPVKMRPIIPNVVSMAPKVRFMFMADIFDYMD